ncbi:exodeoxyribonuclease III [Alteriqipengyuania flavescens]|uniref:exodeoxyribonuclease III n=1 Tax=Alteriqipengyuania flavescens TaxID=3053610 RepID=UPI0025B3EA23|nr:exodeoxyribonuclease III [Alteriqipengyuania flavescens]WJY19380.1 exodeoxyribonuclease III [Alteriqipengyuania flavescens]WJY25322.1 exodeoxyribonuclease III [Alteriqipengyuania flavescens]
MVSVATWNINSVRLRMPIVERFLQEEAPDVLCLQEIKCEEHLFPYDAFRAAGYEHMAVHGQKGYHGVATVSKIPLAEFSRHDWQDNGEARHVGVELTEGSAKGVVIENVYIPAGGDEPDRDKNPKFGQKLDFLGRMTRWADVIDRPTLIVGDFNIAPLESDVWNHKQLLKVVSHTPIEVETLQRFKDAHGWTDVGREHILDPERYYTWWSYRNRDHTANDRGRRLDHMWASPDLAKQATGHRLREDARAWEKPSDHIPVITEFTL